MTALDLLRLRIHDGEDALDLRHLAGWAARGVGLEDAAATRVATAVSELARVVGTHLPVDVRIGLSDPGGRGEGDALLIELTFIDRERPAQLRAGSPAWTTVERLMDGTELRPDGLAITKRLPRPISSSELAQVRDRLNSEAPRHLRSVLQSHNDELVAALLVLREREAQLMAVNAELERTAANVVALNAELERRATQIRSATRNVMDELGRALRPEPPELNGVEFGVRYLPSQAEAPTGGDLYDWVLLPDGSLHVTIVDVQGHGVTATRDALLVTHAVRTVALESHEHADLLRRVDRVVQAAGHTVVATVLAARFDPTTGVLAITSAGHPPALLVSPDATTAYLDTTGRPLGYAGAGHGDVVTQQLQPGDCVVLYTDGLVEIRHDILEGLATLEESAVKAREMDMPQLLDTIVGACARGHALSDDTLLLVLRWKGPRAAVTAGR